MYTALADLVVVIHLAFISFVIFGALLILWWRRLVWIHLPALLWGAATELFGLICPLTPLENYLRSRANFESYTGDFIDNYLMPLIYPAALSREMQLILGVALLLFNLTIYVYLWQRLFRGSH